MAKVLFGVIILLLAACILVGVGYGVNKFMGKSKPVGVAMASNGQTHYASDYTSNGSNNNGNNSGYNGNNSGYNGNNSGYNGNNSGYNGNNSGNGANGGYAEEEYEMEEEVEVSPAHSSAGYSFLDDDNFSTTMDDQEGPDGMNVESMMPSSWRGCDGDDDEDDWANSAPSKAAFDDYMTASGSVRMGMNTRTKNPTGGITGLANMIRPAPVPVSSNQEIVFNDSSFRQDMVLQATNMY